jgi:hypothetical protein
VPPRGLSDSSSRQCSLKNMPDGLSTQRLTSSTMRWVARSAGSPTRIGELTAVTMAARGAGLWVPSGLPCAW